MPKVGTDPSELEALVDGQKRHLPCELDDALELALGFAAEQRPRPRKNAPGLAYELGEKLLALEVDAPVQDPRELYLQCLF